MGIERTPLSLIIFYFTKKLHFVIMFAKFMRFWSMIIELFPTRVGLFATSFVWSIGLCVIFEFETISK
jgi:hypothetical protein